MQPSQCLGEIRDTGTAKGRGVFATRSIEVGEIVEACPVVLVEGSGFRAIPTPVRRLLFNWRVLIQGSSPENALALGYGSLYNHAKPANLRYSASVEFETLVFTAARAIAAGEELTVNYNHGLGEPDSDDTTWFDKEGLTAI